MKEVMSWCNAMKGHLPGLVSPDFSLAPKDPSKEAKKRPLQCMRNNGMGDDDDPIEKKRRLTVEQVKFLETSFNIDIKLEPERKALLAKQLGVRPRQVAIWFQNRRARWKNKQVEQEFEALKASYAAVVEEKENLLKEYEEALEGNKKLQAEVIRLTSLLKNIKDEDGTSNKESATKEEQMSDKSELMSPTKSVDEQSEIEDLVMPSDAAEVGMLNSTAVEELEWAIAWTTRLEGENSHVTLSSLPLLVQQLIANGYCLEDAMHIFCSCEDHFGGGFSLHESC